MNDLGHIFKLNNSDYETPHDDFWKYQEGLQLFFKMFQYFNLKIKDLLLDSISLPGLRGMTLESTLNMILLTGRPLMTTL